MNTLAGPINNDIHTDRPVGPTPAANEAPAGAKLVGPDGFAEALAITQAIVNGGLFAAAGSNAAHDKYDIAPAITYLQQLGASQAASNV